MFDRASLDLRRPRSPESNSGHLDPGEAKFRALLESAPDGIVVVDSQGRMTIVNARLEAMFGYRREELLGRPVELLVPAHARGRHGAHRRSYMASPTVRPMGSGLDLSARRKDGSEFPVEVSLSHLTLDDDNPLVTAVIRDVSERAALEEERKRFAEERMARAAAEAASRAKDELLAVVSHELRAPLSAMLGWAVLVHQNPGNADILARAIAAIERNAHVQRRLVDDLLDVARIAAGAIRVDMVPTELATVVDAALDAVRPDALAKGIVLESDLDAARVMVAGDPTRLQQVFWNLVMNGVKFTPAGGRVVVRSRQLPDDIEVAVEDTGQGIAAEMLPSVFERFRQDPASAASGGSGLGLGLAIAKDLVERHGGTIVAESDGPNRGSRLTVRLPLTSGAGAAAAIGG